MKTFYACFDCGSKVGNPMVVWRFMGHDAAQYLSDTLVHRGGQGCHKSMTSGQVRDLDWSRATPAQRAEAVR